MTIDFRESLSRIRRHDRVGNVICSYTDSKISCSTVGNEEKIYNIDVGNSGYNIKRLSWQLDARRHYCDRRFLVKISGHSSSAQSSQPDAVVLGAHESHHTQVDVSKLVK